MKAAMPTQTQEFLQKAESVVGEPQQPDPNAPLVAFQSSMKLTRDQEKRMIDHAFKRMRDLEAELGRDKTVAPNWWMGNFGAVGSAFASQGLTPSETFMGKRSRFDATFLNDVSYRPYVLGPDSIFNESNLSTPVVRRVCRQMIARAKNRLFGVKNWFDVDPAPVPEHDAQPDAERADRIEKFCRFKLGESRSEEALGRAIERALVLGECPVKTSYVMRDQVFDTEARVLVSFEGEPVRAADGNFITEGDPFVDAVDPMGVPKRVLQRDGVTEEPAAPLWKQVPLPRRQVLFEGARSEPIYFKDWLMPLTAQDVQTADTCVHLYDKPVTAFVDMAVKRGAVGADTPERIEAAQRMVRLIRTLSNNSNQPKAAVNQDNRPNDHYDTTPGTETGGPVSEFCEFYLWYSPTGDGVMKNILLICDKQSRAPVFYDYVANVTTDGLRPVEIVRINPVEGRWYGLGVMELFDSYQTQIDLMVNRWNFSQSRSGRIDFAKAGEIIELERDPNVKLNWGGFYTVRNTSDIKDVWHSVYLNDIKFGDIQTMIQFFLQLLLNESGVSNANDDQAAGMASADTATGVLDTAKSGDELFEPIMADLKGPLERIVAREIEVTLANLNPVEVFTYLEGDTMGIDQITPEEVRNLRFKATITLASQRTQEKIHVCAQVIAIIKDFYSLDPMVQQYVYGEYRKQLRALDPSVDADRTIVPIPVPTLMNAPSGAAGGSGSPFTSQMTQRDTQMAGVSAPGGTPAAA